MREEWYVVPARYAFKLREVVQPAPDAPDAPDAPEGDALWNRAAEYDALIDGLRAEAFADEPGSQDRPESHRRAADDHEPPPPRHLPRLSNGQLKR